MFFYTKNNNIMPKCAKVYEVYAYHKKATRIVIKKASLILKKASF